MKIEYIREDNEMYDSLYVLVSRRDDPVGYDPKFLGPVVNFFNGETGEYIGLDFDDDFREQREKILKLKTEDEIFENFLIDIEDHKKDYPDFDEQKYKKQLLAIIDFVKTAKLEDMSEKLWESAPNW